MKQLFIALLFVLTACNTGPKVDYVAIVQNSEGVIPGTTVMSCIGTVLQVSKATGNFVKIDGWAYEGRLSDGHCVKLHVSENDKPLNFTWSVDDNGKVRPSSKLAYDVTKK